MASTQRHIQYSETHLDRFFYDFGEEDNVYDEDEEENSVKESYSDNVIEHVVRELIHNSRRLDGKDISVNVCHSVVTLGGMVRSENEKYTATSLVNLIQGVGFIKNEITVKQSDK